MRPETEKICNCSVVFSNEEFLLSYTISPLISFRYGAPDHPQSNAVHLLQICWATVVRMSRGCLPKLRKRRATVASAPRNFRVSTAEYRHFRAQRRILCKNAPDPQLPQLSRTILHNRPRRGLGRFRRNFAARPFRL